MGQSRNLIFIDPNTLIIWTATRHPARHTFELGARVGPLLRSISIEGGDATHGQLG